MNRQKVNSSTIVSAGWEDGTLEMEFASGGIYQYEGVPKEIFESFMRTESKGHFFQADIRPSYVCVRLHIPGCIPNHCHWGEPNHPDCECWCHKERKDVSRGQTTEKAEKSPAKKAKAKRPPI